MKRKDAKNSKDRKGTSAKRCALSVFALKNAPAKLKEKTYEFFEKTF